MRIVSFITIVVLSSLVFISCRKDKPNQNSACLGAVPFKADFRTVPASAGDTTFYCDTIWVGGSHSFEAVGKYDSVVWDIGNNGQNIRRGIKASIFFPSADSNTIVPVKMIGYRKSIGCFPNEKEIDTVMRNIHLVSFRKGQIWGTYLGANTDNPSDTFRISIRWEDLGRGHYAYIRGFSRNCTGTLLDQSAVIGHTINHIGLTSYSGFPGNCILPKNFYIRGSINKNNVITLEYTYDDIGYTSPGPNSAWIPFSKGFKTFVGTKIAP